MARGESAIRLAVRAIPRARARKTAKAVTVDVLPKLLATSASDNLRDLRDKAISMAAFASGGRRRSEIARLRVAAHYRTSDRDVELSPSLDDLHADPVCSFAYQSDHANRLRHRAFTALPAPEPLLLRFVAQHLWDLENRASDPVHGMPIEEARTHPTG